MMMTMDENIPFVIVCKNYRHMDYRFSKFCERYKSAIRKVSKAKWEVEFINGYKILFVTEYNFYIGQFRKGRTYRIYGGDGKIYMGEYPVFRGDYPVKMKEVSNDEG